MSSEESSHAIEAQEALSHIKSEKTGLSSTEAAEGLKKYGRNQLAAGEKTSPLKIFLGQFKSILIPKQIVRNGPIFAWILYLLSLIILLIGAISLYKHSQIYHQKHSSEEN